MKVTTETLELLRKNLTPAPEGPCRWREHTVTYDLRSQYTQVHFRRHCGHVTVLAVRDTLTGSDLVDQVMRVTEACPACDDVARPRASLEQLVALVKAVVLVWARNLDDSTKRFALLEPY